MPLAAQDPDPRFVDPAIPQDWYGYWLRLELESRRLPLKTIYTKEELNPPSRKLLKAMQEAFLSWLRWSYERNIDDLWLRQFTQDAEWRHEVNSFYERTRETVMNMQPGTVIQLDSHPDAP